MRPDLGEAYQATNREKVACPKTGLYWCGGCDANLVGDWERCGVCGRRNGQKRQPTRDVRRA